MQQIGIFNPTLISQYLLDVLKLNFYQKRFQFDQTKVEVPKWPSIPSKIGCSHEF